MRLKPARVKPLNRCTFLVNFV